MSADLTPRVLPPIDRRRPPSEPESITIHPEVASAAVREARRVLDQVGFESAVMIGVIAALQKQKEVSRRGATYPVESTGQRLYGVHPEDVQVALRELQHNGGDEGPRAEDAMALALAAADVKREERARRMAAGAHRKQDPQEKAAADLALARERARVHVTVSSSRR